MQPGGCVNTDRIEKKILLRATRERVWRALSDSKEFGIWFGVKFDDPFAKLQKQYGGKPFEITIEQMEPGRLFSFRWHPFAVEPGIDYSAEPTTLVVFELKEEAEGIMLTVSETGFDRIPLERRAKAFAANEAGWTKVVTLIDKYLAHEEQLQSHG
jgi:uncharacterized protein YndB with AHSA1/START domain